MPGIMVVIFFCLVFYFHVCVSSKPFSTILCLIFMPSANVFNSLYVKATDTVSASFRPSDD